MLTHMNQIRRRIRTARLRFEPITIGAYTKTTVILAHIEGLSNPALVTALTGRLHAIQRDSVVQINEIAPYLYGHRYTIFPQVRITERVDWVARDLMNGKIAIMVDNDPFVITVPTPLTDFYQTTQDYVFSFWDASLVRLVRLAGLIMGLFLMPLLTSVNPDLGPTKLILTVDGSRQGIPFPPVSEVIIMWLIIEVLREAANRLPKELAVTLGTVGAVVVGTAIVKAGIADDIMIVTVTLTALGLFTTPTFEMTTPWRCGPVKGGYGAQPRASGSRKFLWPDPPPRWTAWSCTRYQPVMVLTPRQTWDLGFLLGITAHDPNPPSIWKRQSPRSIFLNESGITTPKPHRIGTSHLNCHQYEPFALCGFPWSVRLSGVS